MAETLPLTPDAPPEYDVAISFLAADLDSAAFNRLVPWPESTRSQVGLDGREALALESEIEAIIRDRAPDIAAGFVRESPDKLRRIVTHFRASLGLATGVAPRCNAPWVSAVVEADLTNHHQMTPASLS